MENKVLELLQEVRHPDKKTSIVDLKWVDVVECNPKKIAIVIHYPSSKDPFAKSIKAKVEALLHQEFHSVQIEVNNHFTEDATHLYPTLDGLLNVRQIVGISSCKGGVGKSTVTANLAIALALQGYAVGLVDADIYGPSIPKMLGLDDSQVEVVGEKGNEMFIPQSCYGVKVMSIGFFIGKDDPLIWRGPMATSAIKQLLQQTQWGKLDVLLIDMPPGTGDVHLTIFQQTKLSGAIIVTTPQSVAVVDAVKGINMFQTKDIAIPVWGIVENMSWFTPQELPGNKYYIFGKGGGETLAKRFALPLVGQIPIIQSIREGGDNGIPAVVEFPEIQKIFEGIIKTLPFVFK